MKRLLLLLCLAGCAPVQYEQPPDPPSIQESHPDWNEKICRGVSLGLFWEGMTIPQFECSALYGMECSPLMLPYPHYHLRASVIGQTKDGLMLEYHKDHIWVTGYFNKEGKLLNFTKITH